MRTRTSSWLEAWVCLALVTTGSAAAAGVGPSTEAPRFVVAGGADDAAHLTLAESTYDVVVSGVVAEVRLVQTYVNDGPRTLDVDYVFPLSTRAAVCGLTMHVGARTIVAEVHEREAAKAAFDAARAAGRTATLLEQERPNVFRTRVANVQPGAVVEVELRWVELLVPTDGVYELVVPSAVAPRYELDASLVETPADAATLASDPASLASPWDIAVRLAAGVPVQWVDAPHHPIVTTRAPDDDAVVEVGLRDVGARGADDFVLRWSLAGEALAGGVLRYEDAQGDGYFLALVEPPARVAPAALPPREYLFVVDVSGSMRGAPLDAAKHLVGELLGRLGPADRFDVLTFAGSAATLAPASLPATPANLAAARAFLDGEQGGGGTELLAALERAFALPTEPGRARAVVVVTDGFIDVEARVFERVAEVLGSTSVFTFGVGQGVNRHLIEGLARAGRGEPFIVDDPARAAEVADDFATYVEQPLLTNVALAAEGLTLSDLEPAVLPDVYAARPLVVTGRYRAGAAGRLVLTGQAGGVPWQSTIDLARVRPDPDHAALATLWARARITRLSDLAGVSAAEAHRAEVTRLGLAYHLATAHTSFVAIDDGAPVAVEAEAPAAAGDDFVLGAGHGGMGFMGGGAGGGGGVASGRIQGIGVALPAGSGKSPRPAGAPVVGLRLASVKVTSGGASEARAEALVKRRLGILRWCLEQGAVASGTVWFGSLRFQLFVRATGEVGSVTLTARDLPAPERKCLEDTALRRMRFDATQPFVLAATLAATDQTLRGR